MPHRWTPRPETESADELITRHDIFGAEDERYRLVETSASLTEALRQLRVFDREVFAPRFQDGLKQRQITEGVGASPMQVSRIVRRITDQVEREPRPEADMPDPTVPVG